MFVMKTSCKQSGRENSLDLPKTTAFEKVCCLLLFFVLLDLKGSVSALIYCSCQETINTFIIIVKNRLHYIGKCSSALEDLHLFRGSFKPLLHAALCG